MAEILNCENRETTGTLRIRRLRQSGVIPAVLYGSGDNLSLQIPMSDIRNAVRAGSRIVQLQGSVNESALIKHIQWDPLGDDVLHLDLMRVDTSKGIEIKLEVQLIGDAPGTKVGGTVKRVNPHVVINCPPMSVPQNLELKINNLGLNESLTAADIVLPEGASLVTAANEVIVQCNVVDATEETEESDAPAEPEVIGRKADDEEGDS